MEALCSFCSPVHPLWVPSSNQTFPGLSCLGAFDKLCPLSVPFVSPLLSPSCPRGFEAPRDSKIGKTWKMIQPYTSMFPEAWSGLGGGWWLILFPVQALVSHFTGQTTEAQDVEVSLSKAIEL